MLGVTRTFQPVRKGDGCVTAFDFNNSRLMLASYRKHTFEYFPWIFLELFVSEAHATVFLV